MRAARLSAVPLDGEMNERRISEADWKIWRRLHAEALERYSQKVLDDAAKSQTGVGTAHERYLKLYQLIKRRDKQMGQIFDGPSRSDAFFQIAAAVQARALRNEDLEQFSEETQQVIEFLTSGRAV